MARITKAALQEVNRRLLRLVVQKGDEIWLLKEQLKTAKAMLGQNLVDNFRKAGR